MTTFSERSHLRKLRADVDKLERNLAEARTKYEAFREFLQKTGYDLAALEEKEGSSGSGGTSATTATAETTTKLPKRGRSLRENIATVLSDGVARSAAEVLAELKSQGLDPSSSDALSYVRTTLATHFTKAEGRRGYYCSDLGPMAVSLPSTPPSPPKQEPVETSPADPLASFGKTPTKILQCPWISSTCVSITYRSTPHLHPCSI